MMHVIDDNQIRSMMDTSGDAAEVMEILQKSKSLSRLSMRETAVLANVSDPDLRKQIHDAARDLKDSIYGNRLVIFAPLYISNLCNNDCSYCGFRVSNRGIKRRALTQEEIAEETVNLLKTGQKRALLVSGEAYPGGKIDYILDSVRTVYSVRHGKDNIRRINVNIAPVDIEEFKQLKEAEIGTYQLFQETYHEETYHKLHTRGPKRDYSYRLETIDRAFEAGIDDVGIGVLFGLYDWKYEVLALMNHIEHLEAKFGMGPHTISVPRLEPATGCDITETPPYPVSDDDFKHIIAILRLSVPYTGLILSTRENAAMRRASFELGISQISAGSRTNPGGYSDSESCEQFSLGDHRSLDEVIYDIVTHGFIPSFCTSCYRLGRTGLDFMEYAKPGDIKKKCHPNALFTFTEYLIDHASERVRQVGSEMIRRELEAVNPPEFREKLRTILDKIKDGERDVFM
ncbi:[FeFe] hydrogenase H-cluster radical SAM maturase HydG [Myxococcota bacterium]|nr:[FeFe] hydrogenase H-cluster radical SAM maturase HydG [Myxococcota bacterium]MBU1381198.1 [FeFe] hydrogenase H-cluster radical SAM maturase HydG [Myxococcota bacterium]MBU1495620.1 [FeFe] hydrogenase H-cluster radical SAM maturase HydG [Myxococcota bacterium]